MYHKEVTQSHINTASKQLGFTLTPHSISKVQEWTEHLDSLLLENGEIDPSQRPNSLLPEEIRWITNERKLCKLDFHYVSTRYFKVIDEAKNPVLFTFRIPQQIMLEIWSEHELNRWPIELIQLKARQLGASTLTELAIAHRVFFHPYTYAVVASSDPAKSYEMSQMFEFVYDQLPWWLKPERTKYNNGSLMEFAGIHSKISIQHGNKMSGIARGSTPSVVHLTELPDFESPEELVDASLMPAIHPNPKTFLILESTANGFGNWWYLSWKQARRKWPIGRSRLRPVFLPWYTAPDIKPTPTWRLQHKHLLENWEPSLIALKHRERAHHYVHNESPILEQLLGKDWTLSDEQLLW